MNTINKPYLIEIPSFLLRQHASDHAKKGLSIKSTRETWWTVRPGSIGRSCEEVCGYRNTDVETNPGVFLCSIDPSLIANIKKSTQRFQNQLFSGTKSPPNDLPRPLKDDAGFGGVKLSHTQLYPRTLTPNTVS